MRLKKKTMKQRIIDYIARHDLLDSERKYLVAVSGGADSVALLLLLNDLGYDIEVAHCNFHLRDAESDRDEQFVRALCDEHGLPLHVVHFDTRSYAAMHGVSIEMAARRLRYSWFEQLREDIGAAAICVAHHRDDSVETLLINLLRGTGVHGLCGIRPKNGHVIRPLLDVSRSDITDYLASRGQQYVDDSTNFEDEYTRNKIRLNIMPRCHEVNPSAAEAIHNTSKRVADAVALLDYATDMVKAQVVTTTAHGVAIDLEQLCSIPATGYVAFEILKDYGFNPQQVEQIAAMLSESHRTDSLAQLSGKMFLSDTHDLLFDRRQILIEPHRETAKSMKMPFDGVYVCGELRIKVETTVRDESFTLSKSPDCFVFDAAKVRFPLVIRTYKEGERFVPFGMKGTKLVSDFLTDRKRTLFDKRRQMVIADADDKILCLVGERIDDRAKVTDGTTAILRLTIQRT